MSDKSQNQTIDIKRNPFQTQIMDLRTQQVLLEQRLAALEAQAQLPLAITFDRPLTPDEQEAFRRAWEERFRSPGVELEAQTEPEFVPGWTSDHKNHLHCGAGIPLQPSVRFEYSKADSTVTICLQSEDEEDYAERELDTRELKEIIGAVMAVLSHMEAEQSDDH